MFAADGSLLPCTAKSQLGTILCDFSPIAPSYESGLSASRGVRLSSIPVQKQGNKVVRRTAVEHI
jgi:hypothetical protein